MTAPFDIRAIPMATAPWRLSGTVYGMLMNQRSALAALGDAVNQPPYKSAPRAPVLYIKPRNTLNGPGGVVTVPADVPELEIGATLGVVMARATCHVSPDEALDYVAGFTIVGDVSVPHASYYRPSIRQKARDGFCCIGPAVVARDRIADPDAAVIRVYVDGRLAQQADTRELLRPVRRLITDVTDFMTLAAGDILMVGVASGAPRVRAGQQVAIEIESIGRLENRFVAESRDGAGQVA